MTCSAVAACWQIASRVPSGLTAQFWPASSSEHAGPSRCSSGQYLENARKTAAKARLEHALLYVSTTTRRPPHVSRLHIVRPYRPMHRGRLSIVGRHLRSAPHFWSCRQLTARTSGKKRLPLRERHLQPDNLRQSVSLKMVLCHCSLVLSRDRLSHPRHVSCDVVHLYVTFKASDTRSANSLNLGHKHCSMTEGYPSSALACCSRCATFFSRTATPMSFGKYHVLGRCTEAVSVQRSAQLV